MMIGVSSSLPQPQSLSTTKVPSNARMALSGKVVTPENDKSLALALHATQGKVSTLPDTERVGASKMHLASSPFTPSSTQGKQTSILGTRTSPKEAQTQDVGKLKTMMASLLSSLGPLAEKPGVHQLSPDKPVKLGDGPDAPELFAVVIPETSPNAEAGAMPSLLLKTPSGPMLITLDETGLPKVKTMKQDPKVAETAAKNPEATIAAMNDHPTKVIEGLFEEAPPEVAQGVLAALPASLENLTKQAMTEKPAMATKGKSFASEALPSQGSKSSTPSVALANKPSAISKKTSLSATQAQMPSNAKGITVSKELTKTLQTLPPKQKEELMTLINQAAAQKAQQMAG
jgi:hypothetical protein